VLLGLSVTGYPKISSDEYQSRSSGSTSSITHLHRTHCGVSWRVIFLDLKPLTAVSQSIRERVVKIYNYRTVWSTGLRILKMSWPKRLGDAIGLKSWLSPLNTDEDLRVSFAYLLSDRTRVCHRPNFPLATKPHWRAKSRQRNSKMGKRGASCARIKSITGHHYVCVFSICLRTKKTIRTPARPSRALFGEIASSSGFGNISPWVQGHWWTMETQEESAQLRQFIAYRMADAKLRSRLCEASVRTLTPYNLTRAWLPDEITWAVQLTAACVCQFNFLTSSITRRRFRTAEIRVIPHNIVSRLKSSWHIFAVPYQQASEAKQRCGESKWQSAVTLSHRSCSSCLFANQRSSVVFQEILKNLKTGTTLLLALRPRWR